MGVGVVVSAISASAIESLLSGDASANGAADAIENLDVTACDFVDGRGWSNAGHQAPP
jgi:uncharacterized protein (DUF934 family)